MRNQNGSILLIAILMFVLLTGTSLGGVYLASLDMKIAGNYRSVKEAFYNAEAGIEMGQYLLKKIHLYEIQHDSRNGYINNFNSWNVLFDQTGKMTESCEYVISLFDGFPGNKFSVKIEMIVNNGEVMCLGDHDNDANTPDQTFWVSVLDLNQGLPFYKITSTGYSVSPGGVIRAEQEIQIMCHFSSEIKLPNSALYVNGNFVSHGTPNSLIGEGVPTRPYPCNGMDIIGTNMSVDGFTGNFNNCGMMPCDTNQPSIINNALPYPVADLINVLKSNAESITGSNHVFSQDPADINKVYYYNGDLTINNLTGYGFIIVEGSLILGGGVGWNGGIASLYDMVFNGGGNNQIEGVVIAGRDATGNGNPDIYFDCDFVDNFNKNLIITIRDSWKQIDKIPLITYEETV